MSEVWHVYATSEHGQRLLAPGVRAKRYGQAITGRPCMAAYLHDPPRNAQDVAWIEEYLPMWMAPEPPSTTSTPTIQIRGRKSE